MTRFILQILGLLAAMIGVVVGAYQGTTQLALAKAEQVKRQQLQEEFGPLTCSPCPEPGCPNPWQPDCSC